ncbi:holin [Pseudomonas phage UF_RH5]|uniref:Holin n=1 Tax=Pseudomonas phage UF_RH1 TaxID=3020045 RepID=A0AAF0B6K3_9CAUD|nr:holin [Pseudomonas phage UF_RH1]WCF59062.1 holin [Pseudomonas phage UF_RH1]WCZ58267.1 holin [Pseudomonas phage UF_RH5]WOK15195.1 holin [Pseudomonas phage UF_RH9]
MKKPELIEDWRNWWRFWSVRLAAVGTAVTGVLIAFPDAALAAWAILPEEFKSAIPPQYMPLIGVGVFALSIVARLIRQEKLKGPTDE